MNLRDQLAAQLVPMLPRGKYRIVPSLGTIDKPSKPVIQLHQADLEPSPSARGVALVNIKVHVITHREGITQAADDAVDLIGVEVFEALARLGHVNPTTASKEVYNDRYLSYVINTQILTPRSSN